MDFEPNLKELFNLCIGKIFAYFSYGDNKKTNEKSD